MDAAKNLYFTDQYKVIRKIAASDKTITTIAGDKDSSVEYAS